MKRLWIKYSYLFTLLFFVLGIFNIIFAWIGLLCLILPFFFVIKDKEKTWCKSYCPRSNLFIRIFSKIGLNRPAPKWLVNGSGKRVMLIYFLLNFAMICLSTLMVFLDKRPPMEKVKFLIAFKLPWNIPNLLDVGIMPGWAVHLGFRIYSMMFTTIIIGLLIGFFFRARTWCTICPMGTLSGMALGSRQKHTVTKNL
ncbi:hypothetical protein ACHOLT_00545 [Desulfitobacterium sp. Sab5]|uniref:hypothetical protein n=1 Tax=Desulfitobacterium nosdiversum TaxID=3375356 RepID=UPI003CF1D53E